MKLVPEIEQVGHPDYGKPYAAGFGIRIRDVENIHDFDDPAVVSKIIGHLDVPLGATEREVLTESGVFSSAPDMPEPQEQQVSQEPATVSSKRDVRDLDSAYGNIVESEGADKQASDGLDL